jgi:hypothetical protein
MHDDGAVHSLKRHSGIVLGPVSVRGIAPRKLSKIGVSAVCDISPLSRQRLRIAPAKALSPSSLNSSNITTFNVSFIAMASMRSFSCAGVACG